MRWHCSDVSGCADQDALKDSRRSFPSFCEIGDVLCRCMANVYRNGGSPRVRRARAMHCKKSAQIPENTTGPHDERKGAGEPRDRWAVPSDS
jgi:hypothetical protein